MSGFFNRNKKGLLFLARNLFFASIFVLLLEKFSGIEIGVFFNLDVLYFLVFFFGFSWLFFYLEEQGEKLKNIYEPYFKYGFVFLLVLVTFCSLNFGFVEEMESLKTLQEFLNHYSYFIFLLTTGVFFFTLYLNKETVFLKKDTEENKNISKSPRMKTAIILILIMSVALYLRFYNLTLTHLTTDENYLLLASKEFLETGSMSYTRAPLLTILGSIAYYFGQPENYFEYIYWARVPSAIAGGLTTIPIYFLGKRFSTQIAIIAAILWTISPWAIGMAQFAREYSLYTLFVALFTLLNFKFFESIHKKKKNIKTITWSGSLILLFLFYTFKIDTLSTLQYIALILGVFILFNFVEFCKKNINTNIKNKRLCLKKLLIPLGSLGIFSFLALDYSLKRAFITVESFSYDLRWFDMFFEVNSPPMMWFYGINFTNIAYFLMAICFLGLWITKNKNLMISILLFTLPLIFYIVLFDRPWTKARYIFYLLPAFTILSAYAINYIIDLRKIFKKSNVQNMVLIIILLFTLGVFQINNTNFAITQKSYNIIQEGHFKVDTLIEYLHEKDINTNSGFITRRHSPILHLEFGVDRENVRDFRLNSQESLEKACLFIDEYPNGYFVFDTTRNPFLNTPPFKYENDNTFTICNKEVRKNFDSDNVQVYSW